MRIRQLLELECCLDSVRLVDLGARPLPAWSECFPVGTDDSRAAWSPVLESLGESDGFVIVVPEWGGMVPPSLKNLFLLCDGRTELAHKPALIVAISENAGGSYPVAELRMSSYKNTRICYLPEHIILRHVQDSLNGGYGPHEVELQHRLLSTLRLLISYTMSLRPLRSQGADYVQRFPYGM